MGGLGWDADGEDGALKPKNLIIHTNHCIGSRHSQKSDARMNTTPNPTLTPLRNWTEPQTVARGQLATIITEAAAAGDAVFSMDIQPKGYRLPSDFDQAVTEYSISMLSLMEHSICQPVQIHKI